MSKENTSYHQDLYDFGTYLFHAITNCLTSETESRQETRVEGR